MSCSERPFISKFGKLEIISPSIYISNFVPRCSGCHILTDESWTITSDPSRTYSSAIACAEDNPKNATAAKIRIGCPAPSKRSILYCSLPDQHGEVKSGRWRMIFSFQSRLPPEQGPPSGRQSRKGVPLRAIARSGLSCCPEQVPNEQWCSGVVIFRGMRTLFKG